MRRNNKKETGHLRRASEGTQTFYHDRYYAKTNYTGLLDPLGRLSSPEYDSNTTTVFVNRLNAKGSIGSSPIVFGGSEEEAEALMKGGAL
jgi:hypothetical protein